LKQKTIKNNVYYIQYNSNCNSNSNSKSNNNANNNCNNNNNNKNDEIIIIFITYFYKLLVKIYGVTNLKYYIL